MIQALAIILKHTALSANSPCVCKLCGDPTENLTDPKWVYELPVRICVRCGAHEDAKLYWKNRLTQRQRYFIGDLSCFNQAERDAYMTAFNAQVEKLKSQTAFQQEQPKPQIVKPRYQKSYQSRLI